jgi:hypothetical protein
MPGTRFAIAALATVAAIAPPPASAQSASDVLNAAMERHQQRARSIDNYTVVQGMMGTDITTYYEKQMVDGVPVFVTRSTSFAGQRMSVGASDVLTDLSRIADNSTYAGRHTVDGHATHAIRIDDASALGITEELSKSAGEGYELRTMTMYFDAEEYVPRRVEVDGTFLMNGQSREITNVIEFSDYRTVDGLLHPFVTKIIMEGMADMVSTGVSPEQLAEARKQLEDFDRQMAEMPASQRQMMERMMGDRMKQLRSMLESGGTEFIVEVKEVRVNAGPPGR